MKKAIPSILRFLSAVSAFFIGGMFILLIMYLLKTDVSTEPSIIPKILIISVLYAASSPITFSDKHFVRFSIIARLLIQTAVNYPILIICGAFFGWVVSFDSFCRITTVYFFAGILATVFICIYYAKKTRLYSDKLREYKKKAMSDEQ